MIKIDGFKIHHDDIPKVITTILKGSSERSDAHLIHHIKYFLQSLKERDKNKTLEHLQNIVECYEDTIKEFKEIANLIDVWEDKDLSSDTKVLENLPNLKKNSFGVDSRSE